MHSAVVLLFFVHDVVSNYGLVLISILILNCLLHFCSRKCFLGFSQLLFYLMSATSCSLLFHFLFSQFGATWCTLWSAVTCQVRYAFELLPSGLVVGERVLDSVPLLSDVRVFMNDGYPTQAVRKIIKNSEANNYKDKPYSLQNILQNIKHILLLSMYLCTTSNWMFVSLPTLIVSYSWCWWSSSSCSTRWCSFIWPK